MQILPVVEGAGDVSAVPEVLRRILAESQLFECQVLRPFKAGDYYALRKRFPNYVRMFAKERAAVLVLLDCDDGCAVEWATELAELIPQDLIELPIRFAFAVREFESFFLADSATSKAHLLIDLKVDFPSDPEVIRGAKEWLSRHMASGKAYKETIDQQALAAKMNLATVSAKSHSFRHLKKAVIELATSVE